MTMHRRPVGRGRLLAAASAIVIVVGSLLPWYTFVGDLGRNEFRPFDGSGILTFIAALATIALVALPYAAGERPVAIDRWIAYLLLALLAWIGIAFWPWDFLSVPAGFLPDRAPGLWLAVIGTIGLSRAAFDISREPPRR
jgi:hypothetical protein